MGNPVKSEREAGVKMVELDWSRPDLIQQVPLSQLKSDPDNPRTTMVRGAMVRLIASIRKDGVKTPCKVRRGASNSEGIVQGGHRRMLAAVHAGLVTIPCILDARKLSKSEVVKELLLDNEHRQDLPPIDKAEAIRKLMDLNNWTQQEVATDLDLDPAAVSTLLRLLALPPSIQMHVNDGSIPVSTAYSITRFEKSEQTEIAARVLAGKLSGGQVSQMLGALKRGKRGKGHSNKIEGTTRHVAFKTDRTFHAPDGVAVIVRSLTIEMNKAQIAKALEAVLAELDFKVK